MDITIATTDGPIRVTVSETAARRMVADWTSGTGPVLTVPLGDGCATHIARAHIVRIDVHHHEQTET